MNQRNQSFRTYAYKLFFFQHPRNEFPRFAMTIFHRIDQRQRDFSFLQIAQHWLSKLLRRRRKIQQIVHELERKSCIGSVIRERLFLFSFESAENSAQSRAS